MPYIVIPQIVAGASMLGWLYDTFLTSRGRIGRLAYLGRSLLLIPVMVAAWFAVFVLSMIFSIIQLGGLILFFSVPALLIFTVWAHVALANRRYHDFDWSGKWQFINLGLIVIGLVNAGIALSRLSGIEGLRAFGSAHSPTQQQLAEAFGSFSVGSLVINLISLGMLLHLLFRPGTDGENRFDETSRLPGVFSDDEEPAPAPTARPAPAYHKPAAPTRRFGTFDGQPRGSFGLKS